MYTLIVDTLIFIVAIMVLVHLFKSERNSVSARYQHKMGLAIMTGVICLLTLYNIVMILYEIS